MKHVAESAVVPRRGRQKLAPSVWEGWDDARLLELRFSELDLRIEGSPVEPQVAQVLHELHERGLRFRLQFWLSNDWFCPDGVPGVAIPFYMAHPRLAKLEHTQMLEVEGGTPEWCLRILRHEAGHAIENAYRLRRLRRRIELFGPSSQKYPDYYTPRPYSKSYVINLDSWYAQSHPDEDFAETFAVWLTPGSDWAQRYAGWKAFEKLEYVDGLMKELAGRKPEVRRGRRVDALRTLRQTLREHYEERRRRYRIDEPELYDRDLRRLFSSDPEHAGNMPAARFLQRLRREARRIVRRWTGEYLYIVDQVLTDMIGRCRELDLRLREPEDQARQEFLVFLAIQTMNYLHSGRHRQAL